MGQLIVLEETEAIGLSHWYRNGASFVYYNKYQFSHLKSQNYLALNLFLDEVILALVIEDDMDFLCAVATDIRTWVK